jgi:hypothetical protein
MKITGQLRTYSVVQLEQQIAFNVAIAIEHIVLRALDFVLVISWIRLFNRNAISSSFGWDEDILPGALLLIGFPAEDPIQRKTFEAHRLKSITGSGYKSN